MYSGSNIGEAVTTVTLSIETNCENCIQLIVDNGNLGGIKSLVKDGNQVTVVQNIQSDKIRKNTIFSKPLNMTAVLGINANCCKGCKKKVENIISLTPGCRSMVPNYEKRTFRVEGVIAINTLATELEKKAKKIVRIISLNIKIGGGGGGIRCSNPNCRNQIDDWMKTVVEILKA